MNLTTVFSTLGNNSSLWPIGVKDALNVTGLTTMAYNQGNKYSPEYGKLEAREVFTEELTTSVIWLGGIPFFKKIGGNIINKIYNFKQIDGLRQDAVVRTNSKLFNKDNFQSFEKNIEAITEASSDRLKTLKAEAQKILENPSKFTKFKAAQAAFATVIPLVLIGFAVPKANQYITKQIKKEKKELVQSQPELKNKLNSLPAFKAFIKKSEQQKQVSFGGFGNILVDIFNNPVTNMAVLDTGIGTGRVATARHWVEGLEKGLKEAGIVFFIYLGGPIIAKGIEKLAKKFFDLPISLDPKILENKEFQIAVKEASTDTNSMNGLKSFAYNGEKAIVEAVDGELRSGGLKNFTFKMAEKLGIIDIVDGIRNPLKYVETKDIVKLNNDIIEFAETAAKKSNIDSFMKKAIMAKRTGIAANIAICSASVAIALPKIMYFMREKLTNSAANPGIKKATES
jgi:hypothetical protein